MKPADREPGAGGVDMPYDVREHNLRKLFERAYVPVEPAAGFRARLVDDLRARIEARARYSLDHARREIAPSKSARPRTWRTLAAAAAVLVVVFGSWFALRSSKGATASLEQVLARGCVAWRTPDQTGWNALDAREARRGIDVTAYARDVTAYPRDVTPRALEVATPSGSDVSLRFGSLGRATLGPDSRAALPASPPVALELASGALSVERYDSGGAWTLEGCDSYVELERGAIDLSIADAALYGAKGTCFVAHLTRGAARARVDEQMVALEPGTRIVLQSGRALETSVGIADPSERTGRVPAVAVGATPAGDTAGANASDGKARLEARLVPPPGLVRPARITVTLLRHERLPAVSRPKTNVFNGSERFAIDGLEPGDYDVFVETADFAVWRKHSVALVAGSTSTLDVELALGLSLRGRVVDAATGEPLEGAVVLSEDDVPAQVLPFTFTDPPTWSAVATTLSDGTFELLHLPAGECVLRATHAGFGATWSGWVDPSRTGEPLVMRLGRPASVAGHVAHDDKSPWSDAVIIASHIGRDKGITGQRLARMGYGIATTDGSGDYRIDDLPAGSFVVLNAFDMVSASSVRQATLASGRTITIDLPERVSGARLTGKVLSQAGTPRSGMDVTLQPAGTHERAGWRSVQSNANGEFVFNGLQEGSYDVYVGTEMGRLFLRQDRIEVPSAGEVEHDVRLATGILEGHVKRADDGAPCGHSFLFVQERTNEGYAFAGVHFTRDDGGFTIHHVRPGTWRIVAYPSQRGLAPLTSADVEISEASSTATCEIAVQRGASLRVRVKDAAGKVVPGCNVEFLDADGTAVEVTAEDETGPSGVLDVPGVAAGHWTVRASAGARESPPSVIDLLPGDEREIDLVLGP